MNANMKLWIDALRSGKFEQGAGQLKRGNKYCCLGVACEVLKVPYEDTDTVLPFEASELLGVDGMCSLSLGVKFKKEEACCMVCLNDKHGATFNEIADILEREFA